MKEIRSHHITTPIKITDPDKNLQNILKLLCERLRNIISVVSKYWDLLLVYCKRIRYKIPLQ